MIPLDAGTIADYCSGDIVTKQNNKFTAISIDSRTVKEGDLFLALKGEKFDGHDFIVEAVSKGAKGIIVEKHNYKPKVALDGLTIIQVGNSLKTLHDIARRYRQRFGNIQVVGITGSNGKTTTKDFLSAILSSKYNVISSTGNRNNEVGLPLTILEINNDSNVAVLEMAMRGEGQISELSDIAKPNWGIITNIGQSHIELLGSEESIFRAKGELAESLPKNGKLFLNIDDKWSSDIASLSNAGKIYFGFSDNADVIAKNIIYKKNRIYFDVIAFNNIEIKNVSIPVLGNHMVSSAVAAIAVSVLLDVSADVIVEKLHSAKISPMRMEIIEANGFTVINDSYNASPLSVLSALQTMSDMDNNKRKIAVLGDMLELGKFSEEYHRQIGEYVANSNINGLFVVGKESKNIFNEAVRKGMSKNKVFYSESIDEQIEKIKNYITKGDIVLVKASRAMNFEKIVEGLTCY